MHVVYTDTDLRISLLTPLILVSLSLHFSQCQMSVQLKTLLETLYAGFSVISLCSMCGIPYLSDCQCKSWKNLRIGLTSLLMYAIKLIMCKYKQFTSTFWHHRLPENSEICAWMFTILSRLGWHFRSHSCRCSLSAATTAIGGRLPVVENVNQDAPKHAISTEKNTICPEREHTPPATVRKVASNNLYTFRLSQLHIRASVGASTPGMGYFQLNDKSLNLT